MFLQIINQEAPRWIAVLSSDIYLAVEILIGAVMALASYIVLLHHKSAKREKENQKILLEEISASRVAEGLTREALVNNTRIIDKVLDKIDRATG